MENVKASLLKKVLFWLSGTLLHRKWSETTYLRDKQCKKIRQVKLQEFVRCVAAEQNNNNNESSDSSHFYQYILIGKIESLSSEAESSAGKKQIQFNVLI